MRIMLCAAAFVAIAAFAGEETVNVTVDFDRPAGPMKALHGVNNSPIRLRDPKTGKMWEYEEAGIPYMRTHDTSGMWGGTHYVDIPNIFPDFDADENDPKNYDFAFTDAYFKTIISAGTKIYYRLGVTIENFWRVKPYHINPPKDYAKWARICEHIVRHYNEGWADGHRWNIEYWEIWNEPENPPMWKGTREEFFELYRVAANHLKRCFPNIKVGGYGGCGFYAVDDPKLKDNEFQQSFIKWFEEFCRFVTDEKTKAPLDFFSWHQYVQVSPRRIITHADYVRKTLDAAGLTATESHFNEWNYVGPGWDDFDSMLKARGAACMAEAFCLMQKGSVDKAMYYDATPSRRYCGMFLQRGKDTRSKTYFAFKLWNEVYKLGNSVRSNADKQDFGVVAAKAADGRKAVYLVNNSEKIRRVKLALGDAGGEKLDVRLLDDAHSSEEVAYRGAMDEIVLQPFMVAVLETPGIYTKPAKRVQEKKVFAGQDADGARACKAEPLPFPPFESKGAWTVENYMNALDITLDGSVRVAGAKKVKDTAWKVTSKRMPLPRGTKEISVAIDISSTKTLGKGGAMDKQKSSVTWFDEDGKEIGVTALTLPSPVSEAFVHVVDVVAVPDNAASCSLWLGFDRPDIAMGDVIEYRNLVVKAHDTAGEVTPNVELPDMRPIVIERLSPSPFKDGSAAAVFRIDDPAGVDWSSLRVRVDEIDRTAECRRVDSTLTVPAPAEGWTNGLHVAAFEFRSGRGIAVRERRAFFRGEIPNTAKVTMRDDGQVLVDGKPWFPIGAYDVRLDSRRPKVDLDRAHAELKSIGFDLSHTYGNVYMQPDRKAAVVKHGFLQWVEAHGASDDLINVGRFDPTIAAWYLGDDTADNTRPETLRFYDSVVKAIDPTRISVQADSTFNAALDQYGLSRYSSYVTGADVYMPEIYPFKGAPGGEKYSNAVAQVIRDMEIVRRDARRYNDGKPRGCWPILQAFEGWGQWKQFPSLELVYATSMASLIHGAHGITWYTYCGHGKNYGFATSPERWEAMRFTSQKIRELVPVLVERTPADQPTVELVSGPQLDAWGRAPVSCLLKRHGDDTYLLAVNAAPQTTRVRFVGLTDCTEGEAMWEGRRIRCENGTLDDLFGPLAVHVYRFPKSFRQPDRGALLLTFDDPNYDRWVNYIPLFEKYGAHVSFFPYGPLEGEALAKMAKLRLYGHTVGTHTLEHVNLPDYLRSHDEETFWKTQVEPHLAAYEKIGVRVMSFAYPNGRRTPETDEMLIRRGIRHIRGCGDGVHKVTFYDRDGTRGAEWKPIASNDWAFNRMEDMAKSRIFFGATVGEAYHSNIDDLCAAVRRAAKENKILQFTSHDIAPDAHHINMKAEWLERILATSKAEGVLMLGYDELPLR